MSYYVDTTQRWKLSKIRDLAVADALVVADHQRLERGIRRRKGPKELIEAVLNEELLMPFVYSDLESNFKYASSRGSTDEMTYFARLINGVKSNQEENQGPRTRRKYTIEDGRHRTADLILVKNNMFKDPADAQRFWDSEVPVFINYNCSTLKLVRVFSRINDITVVTTDQKLWGYPSVINDHIKELVIKKPWVDLLYDKKRRDESVRDLYKNFKKILIVCGSFEAINSDIRTTNASDIKSFTESPDLRIRDYKTIIESFEQAVGLLFNNKNRGKFAYQAKATFIVHIMKNKNRFVDASTIEDIIKRFPDTRKKSETWYKEIYSFLTPR